ncbi:hypothetical protein MTR_6g025500 [Medicago truncatula]|uniref:Uncharacterized protein n=1 Tax=Medicago truncatula TaxID=3880 RepID=G7KP40_MEDTR|nr:hypothetical protein MTR_6g025500 [Medicago truncatula]
MDHVVECILGWLANDTYMSKIFHCRCFAQNLGSANSFYTEIFANILAMETAQSKGYIHLWLETDSQLVCLALKSSANVPWVLRNRCMSSSLARLYAKGTEVSLKVIHCSTQKQHVDMFTIVVKIERFNKLRSLIGMVKLENLN